MSERFEVGEIAIAVNWTGAPEYEGQDVRVIGEWRVRTVMHRTSGEIIDAPTYEVACSDGNVFCPAPDQLRKKRPPEELGSWSELQKLTRWNPTRVEA